MRTLVCMPRHWRDQKLRRKKYIIWNSSFPEFSDLWKRKPSVGSHIYLSSSPLLENRPWWNGLQWTLVWLPVSVSVWGPGLLAPLRATQVTDCPGSLKAQLSPSLPPSLLALQFLRCLDFQRLQEALAPGKKWYSMINSPSQRIRAFGSFVAKWSRINLL